MQPKKLDSNVIKKYIEDGISRQCAPSVSVGVYLKDGTKYEVSTGNHTYDPNSKKTESTDIYDLASISKVVATTLLLMKLYEDNILDLDQPLIEFLPDFKNIQCPDDSWRNRITTRHLLTHTAGLMATVPGSDFPHNSTLEYRREQIMKSVLKYEPGTDTVYSDVGFMFLYVIAEELYKQKVLSKSSEKKPGKPEELEKLWFFDPMEMHDTCYNPLETKDKNRIVPTEKSNDAFPGEEYLWGVVHDQKARHVGGIDGHAGLFSTVPDLLNYIELFLNKGNFRGKQILKPETIELFTKKVGIDPKSDKCLGLEIITSSGGIYTSPSAFGHTGFTGTFINIDPEYGVGHVLLTNAVHPNRQSKQEHGFLKFRNELGTLIYEKLGFTQNPHPLPKKE
ncbi:hypothetical protein M9Y10_012965 [Tritrichomonas musculus]|uniref:Beta-lactamase-related domain-containing protein n=1 Tax=Tritrichomonas musculus TaxID=1915356 RepID=A0ABR2I5R8_9EUKA